MHYKIYSLFFLFMFIAIESYSSTEKEFTQNQSPIITQIVANERNKNHRDKIIEMINKIDNTYSNLYEKLEKGKKVVIFMDPAHGKLPNGQWQGGDATRRTSCSGLPEEYYSTLLSRKMYELLSKNNFIEVKTTDDFMSVLKGSSDSYNDIPFTKTVELAEKAGAFIIISEHLNNISVLYKADGKVNLPGIHVTRNGYGWKVLQYVKDTYAGFLTLYNKVDASGFSLNYALKLKKMLVSKGLKPNSWNFGAVGDTRYSYFIDFPISVIYESGFISNPDEEKNLKDPEYINKIVESQYNALLDTFKEIFSVDISGSSVKKSGDAVPERIELLKLARLAIYYIGAIDINNARQIIREMEKKFSRSKYKEYTYFFTEIKNNLAASSKYYEIAAKHKRNKRYKQARKYFWLSRKYIYRAPIFNALRERYRNELHNTAAYTATAAKPESKIEIVPVKRSNYSLLATKAPIERSIIFPIEQNQSLEKALSFALSPDAETLKKLVKSFKNANNILKQKTYKYSKKKKRKISSWKEIAQKCKFGTGIYVVKLDKNLNVISVKYVNSATLNPAQYQNQQYLKNSYFSHDTKERAL